VKNVAIIGGGLAGLSWAHSLKRRGFSGMVFDAAEPGRRDAAAFYLLAPDLFRNTFQLIRDLGLNGDVIGISPQAGQVYKGRVYHHHVASAAGLLTFKGLNIVDKALLSKMAYLLARYSSRLDFHRPDLGLEFDRETVASFVKRELSQNVLNYVAGPLISSLFYYGSEETSAWLYLVLAKHMYNVRMSTLRGGVGRMSGELSKNLNIGAGRAVSRIVADGERYIVNGDHFSDVVVAVPGDAVLSIEGIDALLSETDRQFFRDCQYQPVTAVRIVTDRPVDGRCYAVSVPRVEKMSVMTITFHDYIDAGSVPNGEGLMTIIGGGASVRGSQLIDEFNKLYSVTPHRTEIIEWKSGMPKFPPGRYREIARFQQQERRPGLFFCGDYLLGPFIEGAITSGFRAAEAIRT